LWIFDFGFGIGGIACAACRFIQLKLAGFLKSKIRIPKSKMNPSFSVDSISDLKGNLLVIFTKLLLRSCRVLNSPMD